MAECPFCDYAGPSEVIEDSPDSFVIEPLNPVTDGHLLVIPYAHDASPMYMAYVFEHAHRVADERGGRAWNIILSKGAAASQTIEHPHVHVVPRRDNDGLMLPWSPDRTARLEAALREIAEHPCGSPVHSHINSRCIENNAIARRALGQQEHQDTGPAPFEEPLHWEKK